MKGEKRKKKMYASCESRVKRKKIVVHIVKSFCVT